MREYENIQSLILNWKNLEYGRIYLEYDKGFLLSKFWVVSSKEQKDNDFISGENGYMIPICLANYRAKSFLDTATFEDIISLKLENNKNLTINDFDILIHAINHYLEHDDFED